MTQFKFPVSNVPAMLEHMKKFNRICAKLNLPAPVVTYLSNVIEKKQRRDASDLILEFALYEIEGVSPKLNGWAFKSKLEKQDDGDEIRSVPGFDLPLSFHTRETCDHCKAARKRNRYFFVQNEEEGSELLQVGSSCVKDFLGHKNPEQVAAWFEYINNLGSFQDYDESNYTGRHTFFFDFDEALAVTFNRIREKGFMSRKRVEELGMDVWMTTSSIVCETLYASLAKIDPTPHYVPTEKDRTDIAKMIAWFEAKGDSHGSDFIINVQNTLAAGIGIRPNKMGFIAAAVNMFIQDTEVVDYVYTPSEYYGQIKDKLVGRVVTFVRQMAFDGAYGTNYVYTFKDAGHEFTWSTGSKIEFTKDEEIKLSGTVKGFKTWTNKAGREHKQTQVTRCKIEELTA